MKSQGLDLDNVKLFYGGHSLGSVFIQDHLFKYHGSTGPMGGKVEVLGQILMGGFIQRKYAQPEFKYPVTTLTLGGELDGLARPNRIAEAIYHQVGKTDFPVVVIAGINHMGFAGGAPTTAIVKARDLIPEKATAEGHSDIAEIVAPYMEKLAGIATDDKLSAHVASTQDWSKPLIAAYELEGNRWFNAPNQIGGPGEKTCVKGGCSDHSEWASEAQKVISSVDGWKLEVENQYVDCTSTPLTGQEFHLPVITNNTKTKTLHITTYSQCHWDDAIPSWFSWKEIFDQFDTGFIATSAEEIGTKLASRQCTLIQGAGQTDTPFSVDDPQFCAMTNKKAYEWAVQNAGSVARKRFEEKGQKFVFGDDIPKSGGPWFLNDRLKFNEKTVGGESVMEITAPMQKTEIDYWEKTFGPIPRPPGVPDPGCFHYCKLLSPARAMEWIYVDSLRKRNGVASQTASIIV